MKRLNKKGFTLVELLAVIIILAVVVGITIPAVLTTVNDAQEKQFETASKNAADWFDRQYQAYLIGNSTIQPVDSNFAKYCDVDTLDSDGNNRFNCANPSETDETKKLDLKDAAMIAAAGLNPSNIARMRVFFKEGRACVMLVSKDGGDYITNAYPAGSRSWAGGSCESIGYKPGIYHVSDTSYK